MGRTKNKSKKSHKKHKSHKEGKIKHKSKKSKKDKKRSKEKKSKKVQPVEVNTTDAKSSDKAKETKSDEDFSIPIALMNSKSHAPETPEEYQRRQSQIRREVDPVTGRTRLIKGDSEILEEIVSKDRHKDINKRATCADGEYYEERSLATAAKRKKQ